MSDERDRLIDEIVGGEARLQKFLLADRSNPLLSVSLTIQQLKALLILSFLGSASGHELAEGLGVGLASVTGIVDRLGAQGLVRRAEDPRDRRVRRVYASQKGKELAERVLSAGLERRRRLLSRLDLETLRGLREAVERLEEAAEAEAGLEASRIERVG